MTSNETRTANAIEEITAERRRQIEVEGWSHEHDDKHDRGEMATAAAVYALPPGRRKIFVGEGRARDKLLWLLWPWEMRWFKPGDRRRELVKAGALIVAEIDRLDRAASVKMTEQRKTT